MGRHRMPSKHVGRHRAEQLYRGVPMFAVNWRGAAFACGAVWSSPRRRLLGAAVVAVALPVFTFTSASAPHANASPADLRSVSDTPALVLPMLLPIPPTAERPQILPVALLSDPSKPVFDDEVDAELAAALSPLQPAHGGHGGGHSGGHSGGHGGGGHSDGHESHSDHDGGHDDGHDSHASDSGHCR